VTLLKYGALVRIRAVPGQSIGCVRGTLWVTLEGDTEDHILAAGELLSLPRRGMILVNALAGDAALSHPYALRLEYPRPARRLPPAARPLAELVDRVRPGYDPGILHSLPPAAARALVEREVRAMRAELSGILLARAGLTLARAFEHLLPRIRSLACAVAGALRGKRGLGSS
jgi:hypothetical protein